ncbi:peptidylprolyl isomerase [Hymenobacter sp. BT683]|uniref:Peptidyl-prolyl cis-trans isomerase n=1 Tax=Hymenobacter jeongseonensis TaxID=2791027 RepID=A0ABS0IL62_9BACT|nr:peptidylprolyl isomerase [Hymenobacter jeongseonensis]MBF9239116.1 peptidylprolyl isomerase [Hymenobacter jeongseonensis]
MKFSVHRFGVLLFALLWVAGSAFAADKPAKPAKKSSRDEVVTITTAQGIIRVILFDDTPLHKANFLKKAKSGFYDGTSFHRVIPNFMVQGGDVNSKDGDPSNDGLGQANEGTVAAELVAGHQHNFGALAAARQGDFANPQRASSISQFYLVQNHDGTHFLDGQYTVFGQTIQGLDVIDKIAALPRDGRDHPTGDAKMTMKIEKLKRKRITKLYGYKYE